jgi:hypothetical protein
MDLVFFMFWMNLLFNREFWTDKDRGILKISLSLFLWFLYWLFLLGDESDDVLLLCGRWSLFVTNDKLLVWTILLTFLSSCFSDFIFNVHQEGYCVIIISLNFSCYLLQRYCLLFIRKIIVSQLSRLLLFYWKCSILLFWLSRLGFMVSLSVFESVQFIAVIISFIR